MRESPSTAFATHTRRSAKGLAYTQRKMSALLGRTTGPAALRASPSYRGSVSHAPAARPARLPARAARVGGLRVAAISEKSMDALPSPDIVIDTTSDPENTIILVQGANRPGAPRPLARRSMAAQWGSLARADPHPPRPQAC